MKFEDALKELKIGNCEGIVPHDWIANDSFYVICKGILRYLEDGVPHGVNIGIDQYLGEWKLINSAVRPKRGEVWADGDNLECFITQTQAGLSEGRPRFRAWHDGTWGQVTADMIDGKNGWMRVYSPDEGDKS